MASPISLRFYTAESIGPRRHWTNEGYLLCSDVPIARVGTLFYGRGEIPVQSDDRGQIRIQRTPNEVFAPSAILSFAGKPVCDSHPPDAVSPETFRMLTRGVVLHPHRGDPKLGEDSSVLYADLLIQDASLIHEVLAGRVEVSAGYDARYEQIAPGEGAQHDIIGNHVAIVDLNAKGRCGPLCSIGDSTTINFTEDMIMPKRNQRRAAAPMAWRDRIMQRFHTGDESGLVDELDKVGDMLGDTDPADDPNNPTHDTGDEVTGGGATHVHIHAAPGATAPADPATPAPKPGAPADPTADPAAAAGPVTLESLGQRMDRLEQAIAILLSDEDDDADPDAPTDPAEANDDSPTGDSRRAAVGDSTSLRGAFTEMLSRAEALVPGMRHPTFDAKQGAKTTYESMCGFRRRALNQAIKEDGDSKDAVSAILSGRSLDSLKTMTCDSVQMVFNGASEAMRALGNRPAQPGVRHNNNDPVRSLPETISAINERNRKFFNTTNHH